MYSLMKYETAPYSIQLSQNLTSDCLLISVFLPVFTSVCMIWSWNCFILICRTILWPHHAKTGKNTELNKQSDVKFWLNWMMYGNVSYSLSCTCAVQNYKIPYEIKHECNYDFVIKILLLFALQCLVVILKL